MFKLKCIVLSIFIFFEYVNAWSGFESIGGVLNDVAAASWSPGRIDVFGNAPDGLVWHKSYGKGAWTGYENLGGNTYRKPGAFSIKTNWVDVIYTGTDQALYRKTWDGSKGWIDWRKNTNGGKFISGPTLTATPGDTTYLHVFVIGTDKALYHCVVNVYTNAWSTWENLGGGLVGDPAAVSWAGRFDVFSIAGDNQLWQKTYENGWRGWQVVSGGLFKPGVGAATKGPGQISVFAKGMDDAIWHRSFSNGQWNGIEKVGGIFRGSAAAVSTGSTRIDVFGSGSSDGVVWRSYWETRKEGEREMYGCYRGYCWSRCSTTFVDVIANEEWCYTTKGNSQDYNYVSCNSYESCVREWKCAGPCSV